METKKVFVCVNNVGNEFPDITDDAQFENNPNYELATINELEECMGYEVFEDCIVEVVGGLYQFHYETIIDKEGYEEVIVCEYQKVA